MEEAKRAHTVETPKQPSFHLRLRAPELYSTRRLLSDARDCMKKKFDSQKIISLLPQNH